MDREYEDSMTHSRRLRDAVLLAAAFAVFSCAKEPVVLEAESLNDVSADPNYGVSASKGWGSYSEQSFSGQRAALTRMGGAVASGTIPHFHKGTYRAEVIVLNYAGGGRNSFDLTLGGVTKKLRFGGRTSVPGLTRIADVYFENVDSDALSIRAVSIGQNYLVIDLLKLVPYSGPIQAKKSVWEQGGDDIQGQECVNCVQAESLRPVSVASNYGQASAQGWASYLDGSYSAGRAALTRLPGAVMSGRIPNFRPGAYRVTAAVNVIGSQSNIFELQLGGQTKRITFGGAKFAGGVTHLDEIVFDAVDNDLIAVRARSVGQPYLIIDAFSLEPFGAVPPVTKQPYTVADVDPIIEQCHNCIEAESMTGVSTDANYGNSSGSGWGSYQQDVYSKKRAALTRLPGATMTASIPSFRKGNYRVTVTALNYDPKKANTFDLTVDNQTQHVTFGPGSEAGLMRIRRLQFNDVGTALVVVKAVAVDQPYLVIDNLSFEPYNPAPRR
jgi:hypothetical protein